MAGRLVRSGSVRSRLGPGGPLFISLAGLAAVFVLGVFGYRQIEGWSVVDSLYMVLITLATIGYGEVHPLSETGRWFTIGLIVLGLGNFALVIAYYTQALADGSLLRTARRRGLDKKLDQLQGHCILCGYGRIGQVVAGELADRGQGLVIIESDASRREALEAEGLLFLIGDATSDDTLRHAGIERAATLVTTMSNDAENVYVTLSARHMNEQLRIVSSAGQESNIDKLRKAGADEVLLPHLIGGLRLALAVLRPSAGNFIENIRQWRNNCALEEVRLASHASLVGARYADCGSLDDGDTQVVASRRGEGPFSFPPSPDFVFAAGDVVLLAGTREKLQETKKLLA